ncbi:MAG TPA: AbrB family transcriptional regulator [Pseudolabrys sp.]|nr:AbrB family transcriptional regulator [Pseudolabrys sp.]
MAAGFRKAFAEVCARLARVSIAGRWAILLPLSAICGAALELMHLPAALLLGPMAAAIAMAACQGTVRVSRRLFYLAQGVIGCLIARSLPASILGEVQRDWPLFISAVLSVVVVSTALGWLLTRWRVLPGTTAVWGSSPGAASAMTIMAEAYGADIRLVAFMQYLRVVFVAVVASVVAAIMVGGSHGPHAQFAWFQTVAWIPLIETLALVGFGVLAGHLLRIPAGPLVVPLVVGVALQDIGWLTIELPPLLLAASYAAIGWSIGARFSRSILLHAAYALPRLAVSTLTLIAVCGGLAAILVVIAGVDPLTAYLAMSPGGADSVAIIASSTKVDLPFVMAMQAARLVIVLLSGPSLARFVAGRMQRAGHRD